VHAGQLYKFSTSDWCSRVTPIGQGMDKCQGPRGLWAPTPDPFLYISIFQVRVSAIYCTP